MSIYFIIFISYDRLIRNILFDFIQKRKLEKSINTTNIFILILKILII